MESEENAEEKIAEHGRGGENVEEESGIEVDRNTRIVGREIKLVADRDENGEEETGEKSEDFGANEIAVVGGIEILG